MSGVPDNRNSTQSLLGNKHRGWGTNPKLDTNVARSNLQNTAYRGITELEINNERNPGDETDNRNINLNTTLDDNIEKHGNQEEKNGELDKLFTDYFEWKKRMYPEWASEQGFKGYNKLVENYSMEAISKKISDCVEFSKRVDSLTAYTEDYEIYKSIFKVRKYDFHSNGGIFSG